MTFQTKSARPLGVNINVFGKNLKHIRKEYRWSQEQLADFLQISRSSLGSWEEGRAHPHITVLINMAVKLKIRDIAGWVLDESFDLKASRSAESVEGISEIEKR